MTALRNALPAIMIPAIIMGGILIGWFTPTEAAAVAVVDALVVPPIFYLEPPSAVLLLVAFVPETVLFIPRLLGFVQ